MALRSPATGCWLDLLVCLNLMVIVGCGAGAEEKPTGSVSGTVTFEGAPVTEGEVHFYSESTMFGATAVLDSDGHFVVDVPIAAGKYVVHITPPAFAGRPGADKQEPPKDPENIPKKYRTAKTSGFTEDVKTGDNTFKFEMTK